MHLSPTSKLGYLSFKVCYIATTKNTFYVYFHTLESSMLILISPILVYFNPVFRSWVPISQQTFLFGRPLASHSGRELPIGFTLSRRYETKNELNLYIHCCFVSFFLLLLLFSFCRANVKPISKLLLG